MSSSLKIDQFMSLLLIVIIFARVETELIDSICKTITRAIESTRLFVAELPVGVESRDIIHLLSGGPNVLIVGIWGMAGIGKTTIAKAVYNHIRHHFDGKIFLANIGDVWGQDNGQVHLQQQLSENLIMVERLGRKRALVVLDDVDRLAQLTALCGSKERFGHGSRIIITTRDRDLLHAFGVECIHEIKKMNHEESLMLLHWHASGTQDLTNRHILLSNLVKYTRGVPLALELLGSHVFAMSNRDFRSVLSRLETIPNCGLRDILKLCYDGLDKRMKDIFLDISCFFIGKDRSYVTKIINDRGLCGEMAIRYLIEDKLVTVDQNNKLGMHALLQEMGREMIRKRSKTKWTYNVFLSFRGEETRRSFVSHLYATLTNAGIKVFMDNNLEKGENISASLLQAIEGSRISVIIFSRSYARSKWCLEELEKIMECHRTMHQEVLPIFYDVDPSEVRHQSGTFGEAFQKLMRRMSASEYKVMNWRRALTEAANLSGWDSRSYREQKLLRDLH